MYKPCPGTWAYPVCVAGVQGHTSRTGVSAQTGTRAAWKACILPRNGWPGN